MLSDLSLIDCESVASEGKLKYKQASVQIKEFTETHFEFPDSIPDLSHLIRRVSCGQYKVKERLMLLHSFQEPIAIVLEFLHGRRLGIALPLADEDIELLDDMDRLIWDMVRAYNMLVVETSDYSGFMQKANNTAMAHAIYRSIAYQTRRLLMSYEVYRPVRTGVWSEMHLLYRIARDKGLDKMPLPIEQQDGSKLTSTIEHIYKRAIMIGRSDPYHFSFRGVTKLFESLEEWPTDVRLDRKLGKARNDCMFIVDLSSDYPAAPYFSDISFTEDENHLVLDTSVLMKRLNREHKDVMQEIIEGLKGIAQIQAFERMEILRHIMVSWGVHPIRKNERKDSNEDANIVVGLANIYDILHPGYDADMNEIDLDSTAELQMIGGVFQEKVGQERDANQLIDIWKIGNESAGGYSLYRYKQGKQQLRVGDLIALRKKPEDGWTICMVRWARAEKDDEVLAGLFKLGSKAVPMSIRPVEHDSDRIVEYTSGLIIPQNASFSNCDLAISQKTLYAPMKSLWIKQADKDRMVVASNLLTSSRSVDVFGYRYDLKDVQRTMSHKESRQYQEENPLDMLRNKPS